VVFAAQGCANQTERMEAREVGPLSLAACGGGHFPVPGFKRLWLAGRWLLRAEEHLPQKKLAKGLVL